MYLAHLSVGLVCKHLNQLPTRCTKCKCVYGWSYMYKLHTFNEVNWKSPILIVKHIHNIHSSCYSLQLQVFIFQLLYKHVHVYKFNFHRWKSFICILKCSQLQMVYWRQHSKTKDQCCARSFRKLLKAYTKVNLWQIQSLNKSVVQKNNIHM